jgi:PAS domain-containing protein
MAGALSRSREALEESERAYRDLFDNAQDLVFTCDLQHRILTVNKAGLAFLGYTFDQLRGRPLLDLIAPAQRERVGESMQAVPPGTSRPLVEAAFLRQGDSEAKSSRAGLSRPALPSASTPSVVTSPSGASANRRRSVFVNSWLRRRNCALSARWPPGWRTISTTCSPS